MEPTIPPSAPTPVPAASAPEEKGILGFSKQFSTAATVSLALFVGSVVAVKVPLLSVFVIAWFPAILLVTFGPVVMVIRAIVDGFQGKPWMRTFGEAILLGVVGCLVGYGTCAINASSL
jgi:hypothetical protein